MPTPSKRSELPKNSPVMLDKEMQDPEFRAEYNRLVNKYARDPKVFNTTYGGNYSNLRRAVRTILKNRKLKVLKVVRDGLVEE